MLPIPTALFTFALIALGATPPAWADPVVEEFLEDVDRALSREGATRTSPAESKFCEDRSRIGGYGLYITENREFLCRSTRSLGAYVLGNLKSRELGAVSARLEVRTFTSTQAAATAKRLALDRFGRGDVSILEGAISGCFANAIWDDQYLYILTYHSHIAIGRAPALHTVLKKMLSRGRLASSRGPIGVRGSSGGSSWLLDAQGYKYLKPRYQREQRTERHCCLRQPVFARVVGVAPDDVLWMRERPTARSERIHPLKPSATCVPVLFQKAGSKWWRIIPRHTHNSGCQFRYNTGEARDNSGYAHSRYLRKHKPGECAVY